MEEFTQENITERVNRKLTEGVEFEFDSFYKGGWNIFKQVFWQVLVGIIIVAIPLIVVVFMLMPLLVAPSDMNTYNIQSGDKLDFLEIIRKTQQQNQSPRYYLQQIVMSIISILISAPLQAGFLKLCREADKEGSYFGDLFIYYKNEYTGRIIAAGLITTLIGTLTGFLFNLIPGYGPFINMFFSLAFYLLFIFITPLIIFGNASITEAFGLSIKLVLRNFFPVVGFIILYWLLSMTGIIVCCIGIVLTIAFVPIGNYLAYKYAVGFPEDEQDDENHTQADGGTPHWLDQPPSAE
jgi:hypothetical protein